jgi:hypothetical protein
MNRRTAKMAATFLVGVMTAVIMPLALIGSPASAAPEAFSLGLVNGQLLLRGAEAPYALTNPTSISGTNNDGALSGVTFSTPVVKTERAVPEYNTTAKIDAAFSMVQPATGTVAADGSMSIQLKLAVDLHIVVGILPGFSDCHAEPINLTLTSTSNYDPETERVTLRAPNFSVPPITASPSCNGVLVDPVNEALAGAGHSLTMTLGGHLTLPVIGDPTATALAVSPAGSSDLGEDVTLTATVTPNPAVPGNPDVSGVVEFLSDGASLGTAEVQPDGTATLTTAEIPAGPRQLTASYAGAPPDWEPSISAAVAHSVIAPPLLSTTAAGEVRIGGAPKDFDVTLNNTDFGRDLEDARLEITVRRPPQGDGSLSNVVLSRVVSNVATPIPTTQVPFPPSFSGEVGDETTWSIDAGEEHTETLRLQANAGTNPGPLTVEFALVTGAGVDEVTLATASGSITMVNEARLPSDIASGLPGFPPFFPDGVAITPRVRQGNVAELEFLRINSIVGGVQATGTWTITVDGVPVKAQHLDLSKPGAFQWLDTIPVSSSAPRVLTRIPRNVPTGVHQVTVRYSGDSIYAPAQESWPITVEEAIGAVYECVASSVVPVRFTANVEVEAALPSVWAVGQELPVDRVQVRMRLSRTSAQENVLASIDEEGRDWRLEMEPDGTLTPDSVTYQDNFVFTPEDPMLPPQPTDHLINLNDATGSVTIDPVPGTVEAYTLGTVNITATPAGFSTGFICEPAANEVYTFGEVTSAGTTLAVDKTVSPVGTPVTLTATALPAAAGLVEFRDGSTTIGVAAVNSNGIASITTSSLAAGSHSLTARFFGGPVATSPSPVVAVQVVATCLPAEPGNGAVVRLVYIELLRRCPDPDGYAYWKGQLDNETVTREQFATQISRSLEAREVIVDDGYQMMLSRAAEPEGRRYWAERLATNAGYDDLLAALAESPEFATLSGGTTAGFVTRAYQRILDTTPSPAEVDYWVDEVERRGKKKVIEAFFDLPGPLDAVITASYEEILGRAPTPEELDAARPGFKNGKDRSKLYASLIGTQEFFDRAQTFPELES